LTNFAHDIAYAYADGLAPSGWRVEVTTVSPQAPTNLSGYSLMVLCWPIYDLNPGPSITNYVHRIGNLQGINSTVITVGGGIDPLNAAAAMNKSVQNANGTIIQSLTMFRSQRNLDTIRAQASKIVP
jgi:hypothetical protein